MLCTFTDVHYNVCTCKHVLALQYVDMWRLGMINTQLKHTEGMFFPNSLLGINIKGSILKSRQSKDQLSLSHEHFFGDNKKLWISQQAFQRK